MALSDGRAPERGAKGKAMTSPTPDQVATTPVRDGDRPSAEQVADYLRRNPDFFLHHTEILAGMIAPGRWSGDRVVDFQKALLDRRLDEIEELRNCAIEVIETSRSNMAVQTRTHAAVLALLATTDFDHMMRVLSDDLTVLLDVDVAVLAFEPGKRPLADLVASEVRILYDGAVDQLVGAERDVRLLRDINDDGTIFGGAAGLVRSAALARLRPGRVVPPGLLALGSRGHTFYPGQGTELLAFLARVIESCVHRWQDGAA